MKVNPMSSDEKEAVEILNEVVGTYHGMKNAHDHTLEDERLNIVLKDIRFSFETFKMNPRQIEEQFGLMRHFSIEERRAAMRRICDEVLVKVLFDVTRKTPEQLRYIRKVS